MPNMKCYLCNSDESRVRNGQVRDAPELAILECAECGLVTLSSFEHMQPGFYEKSGMHGDEPIPMDAWLKMTERDDQRRYEMLRAQMANKKVLDFGCGAGGFLMKAQHCAEKVAGIEPELRVQAHWQDKLTIYPGVEFSGGGYDLITAFHVVEHLPDPVAMLSTLAAKLAVNGRMVIEVPNSDDALLPLFDCAPFQSFTYWSQHLFLFNAETLRMLCKRTGLGITSIQQYQRYPLSNHLHWLSQGKPGGHQRWVFLDSTELTAAYSGALAAIGKCDTLIAHLELAQ